MSPTLYKPDELTIVTRGLDGMTRACEASQKIIELMEIKLAATELRCEELVARNAKLEERHHINHN